MPTFRVLLAPTLVLLVLFVLGSALPAIPIWAFGTTDVLLCFWAGWRVERTSPHWLAAPALGGVAVTLPTSIVAFVWSLWVQPVLLHAPHPTPDGVSGVFVAFLFFGLPLFALTAVFGGAASHFLRGSRRAQTGDQGNSTLSDHGTERP